MVRLRQGAVCLSASFQTTEENWGQAVTWGVGGFGKNCVLDLDHVSLSNKPDKKYAKMPCCISISSASSKTQ